MKLRIPKSLITLIVLFTSIHIRGQIFNNFYASIEDFKNKKPVPGMEIKSGSWMMNVGIESYKIEGENGGRKTVGSFQYDLFMYEGYLMRRYKGHTYRVLIEGKMCYYVLFYAQSKQFFSESITGNIKKLSGKAMKKCLTPYGLYDQYVLDKPKREMRDNVQGYFNKLVARNVKYIKLVNEKKS